MNRDFMTPEVILKNIFDQMKKQNEYLESISKSLGKLTDGIKDHNENFTEFMDIMDDVD